MTAPTRSASAFLAGTAIGAVATAGLFGVTLAVFNRLTELGEDGAHVDAEGPLSELGVTSDRSRVRLDDCIGQLSDELDESLQALRDLNKVFAESIDVASGASSNAEGEVSESDTKVTDVSSTSNVDHEGDCARVQRPLRPDWRAS